MARRRKPAIYETLIYFNGGGMSIRYVQAMSPEEALAIVKGKLASSAAMERGIASEKARRV